MIIVVVITVVMVVVIATVITELHAAITTDARQVTPAVVSGAASGPPAVAWPVTGLKVTMVTAIVVVDVPVTVAIMAALHRTTCCRSESGEKGKGLKETHFFVELPFGRENFHCRGFVEIGGKLYLIRREEIDRAAQADGSSSATPCPYQ